MADDIQLQIAVQTLDAIKEVGKFQKELNSSLGKAEKNFQDFKNTTASASSAAGSGFNNLKSVAVKAFAGIAAAAAAVKIGSLFIDGIKGAVEDEKALIKLNNQLKASGQFSVQVSKDFQRFATEIERTTNTSSAAVTAQLSLAKSFGLSNDESKNLVRAATQLSAITGGSLESSVQTLLKSYQGQTRQLSLAVGETANLTKEQLKNGAAIDLINQKYSGFAEDSVRTFDGSLKNLNRSFGDIFKAVGAQIIQSEAFTKVVGLIAKALDDVSDWISKNGAGIKTVFDGSIKAGLLFTEVLLTIGSVAERVVGAAWLVSAGAYEQLILALTKLAKFGGSATKGLVEGLESSTSAIAEFRRATSKSITENTGVFAKLDKTIEGIRKGLDSTGKQAEETSKVINRAADRTRPLVSPEDIEKARQSYLKLSEDLVKSVATETEKINLERNKQLTELERIRKLGAISVKEFTDTQVKINEAAQKRITKIQADEAEKTRKIQEDTFKKQQENLSKAVAEAAKNPVKIFYEGVIQGKELLQEELTAAGLSAATSFFSALKAGKDGAAQIGTTIAKSIGDTLGPGFGELFGSLFQFFSQDAETIKKQTKEFVEAIPVLIENLIEAAPAFAEAFISAISDPKTLGKLFQAAFKLNAPLLASIFDGSFKRGASEFVRQIKKGFGEIAKAFKDSFLGEFFKRIQTFLSEFLRPFREILSGLYQQVFEPLVNGLKEFASSFYEGVSNAFNVVIEKFQQAFNAIGEFFLGIGSAIGEQLENLGRNIVAGFQTLGTTILNAIIDGGRFIVNGITGVFTSIIDQFKKLLKPITDAVDRISGGSAGKKVSGAVDKVRSVLPRFAQGGIVPAGFPNDSFPARLTSKEMVLPPNLAQGLQRLIDNQGNEGSDNLSVALLSKILAKLSEPIRAEATAELNGRALADIILQLNRNNARLA